MKKSRFARAVALFLSSAVAMSSALPVAATSNYTFPGTGGNFDAEVSTTNSWSVGTGGGLGGQRMLIDMAGLNTVTIRVVGKVAGVSLDMSAAECSWDTGTTVTTSSYLGQTNATLASAPSAGYIDCTLTRVTLTGAQFYVRVPGSPTRISAPILFFLSNFASGGSSSQRPQSTPAPKYSGPEFSSFGAPVLAGNKLVSEGKRLDGITSLKVNGQAVTYKIASASQLEIEIPSSLAPGQYDVEITSTHGKLTHLKAFTVKAVVPTKDHAFKADGGWFNYGDLLALTNTAKTIGDEYTSVKCIVNGADAAVAERLAKRACDYIGANRLRGKAITHEAKSTFTGSGYWVRVIANA